MGRLHLTAIAMTLLVAACTGDGAETTTSSGPPPDPVTTTTTQTTTTTTTPSTTTTVAGQATEAAGSSWTVLVYVMGDTDLEPFALEDIVEMASVGSTDDVNIVALVDRHPEFADGGVLNFDDWEDTKLLSIRRDELVELAGGEELNLGAAATLADFIEVGISSFPADRYAVILWDHGAGWPGMGPDETDGLDVLDLADIEAGFADGLARAGVESVDLVGFDACLMATYEVASVMSAHADFMLASEELEPGHGWDYGSLGVLTARPDATAVDLGTEIISGFEAQAAALGTGEDITLSLLDLSKIGAVQAGLAQLAAPLAAAPADVAPTLGRARTTTLSFGRNPDPSLDANMVDLGGLTAAVADATGIDATATLAALDELVVANVTGPATAGATGLAVYFPAFAEHFRQGYLFIEGVPEWPELLTSYYEAGAAIPAEAQPDFVNVGDEAEYFFDEDGLNVFGTFDLAAEGNLTEAVIFYGILDESDDSIVFIGEEPAEISDDGSGLVAAIYDLTVLTISDGIDTAFAYFALTVDPDTGLAFVDIPLAYVAPGGSLDDGKDVLLTLVLDPDTGDILEEDYYVVNEEGTFGEITTDPEGLIFPVVLNEFPDGTEEWIPTSDVGLFADLPELQYDLTPLDSGTGIFAELAVYDYGGNSASVTMFDFVP